VRQALLLLILFLTVSHSAAMVDDESAAEEFHGTLTGPLIGISCIPDAWLRLCQYPDSVMSVTSDSIDLSQFV